jgi:hypothetical protein
MLITSTFLSASAAVSAPPAAAAGPPSGCHGIQVINPLCQLGGVAGSVASSGVNAVLNGLSQWVASGAEWLLRQIGDVLVSTTTINVGAGWFRTHYGQMIALAGVVILPLLLVSTLQAIYRQNPGQLLRAFFLQLPLALLLGVVAIQIVVLSLSATDAMCSAVAGGSGSDVKNLLAGVTKGLLQAGGDPTMATFVLLMVGLLVAAASFVLWLELLVRAAAVYVAVLFLPLALATLVWPSISHWCRRLIETLAALILSKFVIVATLSLAAGAVASGTAGSGDAGSGFSSVLAGGALLILSTFVPFAILRLIPLAEAGAIGHLDGTRQRAAASLTRLPRTAANYALREGRESLGADKLKEQAGPPGTHSALAGGPGAGGGAGGSGSGGSGGGGGGGDGGTDGAGSEGSAPEAANMNNGWLKPGADGMMQGNPATKASLDAAEADDSLVLRPRGRRPILVAASPPKPIGHPGPGPHNYALGRDWMGPSIYPLPSQPADGPDDS